MTFHLQQSEAQFQAAVMEAAALNGWDVLHIRRAMNDRGYWRTPVVGSLGPGFPDLMLVKGNRLVFIELKAQRGQTTALQKEVIRKLSNVGEVYVCRPSDWPLILEVLTGAVAL